MRTYKRTSVLTYKMLKNTERKIKLKIGVVVSDAMDKTVAVRVNRRVMDPTFKKYVSHRKKFLVHDAEEECDVGDIVQIEETKPLSRHKQWRLVKILKKGLGREIALNE